jgi:hypothetical protein
MKKYYVPMGEMVGSRFGRLLVVKNLGKKPNHTHTFLECICSCGETHVASRSNLLKGDCNSCGCLQKEITAARSTTHGQHRDIYKNRMSPIQTIFNCMYCRCYLKSHKYYHYYGGRGINICDEWLHNRKSFFDWAFVNGFKAGLTIDRIDNNKGYEPDNCRFATMKEQSKNKRPRQARILP